MSWVPQTHEHSGRTEGHQTSAGQGSTSPHGVSVTQQTKSKATAGAIKRFGRRASRGSWTIYAAPSEGATGRLITGLGRTAGGSVTRSRVRRIAREAFSRARTPGAPLDMLLVARGDVELEPRRKIRTTLQGLMARATEDWARRQLPQETAGA
jgi:ribonuclease P protein component